MSDAGRVTKLDVPPELEGERADRVVAQLLGVSRSQARAMLEAGAGTPPATRMGAGSSLEVGALPEAAALVPERVDFGVLYEDSDIAVIDKPAGLVTHPGAGNEGGTLAAGLIHRWPEVEGTGADGRWGIVHRLDRGTSGLLVVAKTPPAYEALTAMMRLREVERIYQGLAEGRFEFGTGTIDAPIAGDPGRPTRRRVDPRGRPAVTHYTVIEELPEATLLEIRLETGRTHQIRVHMSAIDHPLVGDRDYGSGQDGPSRIWLHAWRLRFDHPISHEPVEITSPLPPDLATDLEGRRAGESPGR